MTDLFGRYRSLLKADGTNQLQRTLPALEQGYVRPDERTLSDLLTYGQKLAAEIRFYNLSGQPAGDWRAFLEPLLDPSAGPAADRALPAGQLEAALAARRDWPPHLALYLAFLHLYGHLQADLNELPERHLRHYDEAVLGLLRRAPAADAVHVLFELARNAAPVLLPAGTALDAGKDAAGRPLTYVTRGDLVVSAARVAEVRRLVAETDRRGARRFFVSDSVDITEGAGWHTFGGDQLALDPGRRFMREAAIGFALASPVLRLAEGERTITVRAPLRSTGGELPRAQGIGHALIATLTGAEGWLAPDTFTARLSENPPAAGAPLTLEITLGLGVNAPALVSPDPLLHTGGPASPHPVLRLELRGDSGLYETLAGLVVTSLALTVDVKGVQSLTLFNDQGPQSAGQPVPLFGGQPRIGSHFFVGSAEAFSKRLTSLALALEWQDAPADLFAHYRAYFDRQDNDLTDTFESRFLIDVDLLHDRRWHGFLHGQTLFGGAPAAVRTLRAGAGILDSVAAGLPLPARPAAEPLGSPAAGAPYGFLRFTLRGPTEADLLDPLGLPYASEVPFQAFGHQAFGRRYAVQALALSRFTGAGVKPELPNEPYTPTLAGLSLDYTAAASATVGDLHADEALFVLQPWGYERAGGEVAARLVPDLDPEAARDPRQAPFQGSLFLGIAGLVPPANLSLLFQVDRGTAAAAEVLRAGETEWSQLSGDRWQPLPPTAVLNDATRGFQQPGLMVLAVGGEASTAHTAMPAGLVWLRALIRRAPESAARTLALHSQAALAELAAAAADLSGFEAHLRAGLPAGAIQRLRRRDPAIRRVSQPYASAGGRGGELDGEFFQRSSERLRHRRRAVTAWDLERLVLEAFPEVFKVKALPHSDAAGRERAGEVALVIVPDLRGSDSTNLLEPRAGAVLMGEIEDFVRTGLTTPFAAVHVVHPVYERILVDARVAFRAGLDAGFHAAQLGRELQRFLSPWAFADGEDIVFGARIYRSDVLAFLEGRDEVDFVTGFHLYHSFDGPPRGGIGQMVVGVDFVVAPNPQPAISPASGGMTIGRDFVVGSGVEVAEATRPHAILVSHPAHRITPLDAGQAPCAGVGLLGIGYLTVGLDFEVHP